MDRLTKLVAYIAFVPVAAVAHVGLMIGVALAGVLGPIAWAIYTARESVRKGSTLKVIEQLAADLKAIEVQGARLEAQGARLDQLAADFVRLIRTGRIRVPES